MHQVILDTATRNIQCPSVLVCMRYNSYRPFFKFTLEKTSDGRRNNFGYKYMHMSCTQTFGKTWNFFPFLRYKAATTLYVVIHECLYSTLVP